MVAAAIGSPSQFERDLTDAGPEIARENQRIRQAKTQQQKQFKAWDELTKSEGFQDYLAARGTELRRYDEGLPYAPEAEAACLGAMMLSGRACRVALQHLHPVCFARPSNRDILVACALVNQRAAQRKERIKIDWVTVAAELRRAKKFDDNTSSYLMMLLDSCPSTVNIRAYIKEILECSRVRHQIELSEHIRLAAYSGAHPDHITNATRKALDRLETRGYADLKEIFESYK